MCMRLFQMEASHKGVLSDIRASIDEQWRELLTAESRLDIGDSILTQLRGLRTGDKKEEEGTPYDLDP